MTRERCAELLSRLVQQKLQEAGITGKIEVSAADVSTALELGGRGKGLVGASVEVGNTSKCQSSNTSKLELKTPTPFSLPSPVLVTDTPQTTSAVEEILEHWRETYEPRNGEVDAVTTKRIQEVLDYPITITDCKLALDLVRDNPMLIRRRRPRPHISSLFRSPSKVCQALGREYVPPRGWLEPFDLVWQRHYKTSLPFGQAARSLAPLVTQHGAEEVAKRLDVYCRQTTAMYVSFSRFASTFGAWVPGTIQKTGARDKALAGSMVEGL